MASVLNTDIPQNMALERQFLDAVETEWLTLQSTVKVEVSSDEFRPKTPISPILPREPVRPNIKGNQRKAPNENIVSKAKMSGKKRRKKLEAQKRKKLQNLQQKAECTASNRKGGTWILAVIPDKYPAIQLHEKMYKPIQSYLWNKLEATPDPVPIINIGLILSGTLRVTCEGDYSAEWLRTLNDETVNGMKLKVVDIKDLPKFCKMAWRTKSTNVDITRMLNLVQRLHPSLDVSNWKIVDTLVEKLTTRRIILMDKDSAEYIRCKNYQLNTGVDLSTFKFLGEVEVGVES